MATKLSMTNPGVWFKFNDDDPDSGEICVRGVNAAYRREIRKRCVSDRVEYKHGQRFEYQETAENLFSELLWDYVIVDWTGLEDDDGNTIPCTAENKSNLMLENIGFAKFVGDCMEIVNENIELKVKAVSKN